MARPRVFIHVGAPKTGTTYLQAVLHQNRPALRRAGLLYPGTQHAHFWASQDLRGQRFRGHDDPHVPGAWSRLVREIKDWPGTSVIDHESFAAASRRDIDRALADLAFAEVHVVITARDLARQLPAAWQEQVKNGSAGTYGDFLASIREQRRAQRGSARQFWATQHVPRVLARWSRALPPEQVHVVTVPPPGSDPQLLWRRFAGLLGLDPSAYDTAVPRANTSLGAAEAAVLRRFNAAIAELEVPWPVYASVFKHELAPALARRSGLGIELPEDDFKWAVTWSRRAVRRLRRARYDVVGDLDELIPRGRPTGANPDTAPADAQADAAVAGMVSLVSVVAQSRVARAALRRSRRGPLARRVEDVVARLRSLTRYRQRRR